MNKNRCWIVLIIFAVIFLSIINKDELLKYAYPIQYKEYVMNFSKEFNVDPYLVFAIIKTESKFFPYAQSHKDAKGLMQIGETTKGWAMEELKLEECDLFDPRDNIMIGCWYLQKLFNEFGDIDLVIAAYNGGSGNVNKWLLDKKYSENGIDLHNIPFKETEKYVEKVEKIYLKYRSIYE